MSDPIAARFAAAHEQLTTVGVTGTNGKTTTVSMVEAIVGASGQPTARLTTLGAWVAGEKIEARDASAEFLDCVERSVRLGVKTLALEVTSKALAAGLAKRWPATIGVFTNLSRDHLDMHGSAEHYLASKAQLFIKLPPTGFAILNADDENTALLDEVTPPAVRRLRYSVTDPTVDLAATQVDVSADGLEIELAPSPLADALGGRLSLPIVGRVHAENALAAALGASAAGYTGADIAKGLGAFRGVPGRFEVVSKQPITVVDYAHTPDGLRGTLETARELVIGDGALVCVFGCGGDRDRGKRPLMGQAVAEFADRIILTSDNPRFEEPQRIADDVLAGCGDTSSWIVELDRRRAVRLAVESASSDDVIVVAGKGHESTQEIRGEKFPMSDRELLESALELATSG